MFAINVQKQMWNIDNTSDSKSIKLNNVISKSKVHPRTPELLQSPLKSLALHERSGMSEFQNLIQEYCNKGFALNDWKTILTEYFWERQNNLIMENLKNCTKSAWILPLELGANFFPIHEKNQTAFGCWK